jgi:hypothetical protein
MASPTIQFRLIPQNTPVASLATPTLRKGTITGQSVISTGVGNECDFGLVDISAGANNSDVFTMLWHVADDGGNTLVEAFKLWLSSNGFDVAASVLKLQPLCGNDGTPVLTEKYILDAIISSYTSWVTMPESVPGSINMWPTDEGTSMVCPGTNGASDDAILWAMYAAIAVAETTGIYKGIDTGYELRFSFRVSYS